MQFAFKNVVLLKILIVEGLSPGVSVRSPIYCVFLCSMKNCCLSVFYDQTHSMRYMQKTQFENEDLQVLAPGVRYLMMGNGTCGFGYTLFQNLNLFYKLYTCKKTWHEAKRVCEQDGGHLLKVDSVEVHDFVGQMAKHMGIADRLRDFTVSVSMDAYGQETKCAFYEGAMSLGAVETLPCGYDILGRFVKISKPSTDHLTLCEVQVLVNGRPKIVFERQTKKAIHVVAGVHFETVVADVPSCAEFCKTFLGYLAFGFNPTTRTCRQYRTTMLSNTTRDEWIYYTNIY